ncbi:MAG TPA: exo-beta-N-acetylmuramidase NamZ domain-containing protein [Bryobacteraceae bacterium]|nr:exo-beta-N-acetylmuramidase NamZ domain-containing protein [Bryobacteraceae bacterium]
MRLLLCAMLAACAACAQTFSASPLLDQAVEQAIQEGQIPGAVLLVGHQGHIVHRKAYGKRALAPTPEPMTVDTIFDMASLTKVVATTPSLMKLFEEGKFRLNDRVTQYMPEFQGGKSGITIRDLFTHFSGEPPDLPLEPRWSGYQTGIHMAMIEKPDAPPGALFRYSDINFILLGELVHRLSGQMLSGYAREHIFLPLGMRETMFQPPASLVPRIAPTERDGPHGAPLRGVVHDETSRYMGGVAGHAGLFSTADDLSRYCEMMLHKGELGGTRLFSPLTVEKFVTPESPADQPILRGLGWDIDSPFSGNRGDLFPIGSYGHTGFTGTSIWIDPVSDTYVILLTNSVHPYRRPAITGLRGKVATITAAALGILAPGVALTGYNETISGAGLRREVERNAQTKTGLDVLASENFQPLQGKRVGLITNQTGVDHDGRRNIDIMRAAGVNITALFSPEHGFAGAEDRPDVSDTRDPATGIKVYSLYGKTERPTPEMLRALDALVFDIQDVGARFYTYETTMAYAMEAAAKAGIPYYVLDRPNPITGVHVEGPLLDRGDLSFVGYFPLPLRHGMTMGELAKLFNAENHIGANLTVIHMENWQRGDWFDVSDLPWINPSPNMRSLNAGLLYPGVAMLEYARNYSVGRGTDAPFEQIGADFIHGPELAAYLNQRRIPGVRVYATQFQPTSSNFAGKTVEGVRFVITSREDFDSARLGLEIAGALQKLYPGKIDFDANRTLIGSAEVIRELEAGDDPRDIQQKMADSVAAFIRLREKYLLYR